ncbi:MAG TPA: SCO family protein [Steroidobacteraceae bacterium]|nr:SCO family protein [Steroidobacteraceae bacterium]
MTTKAPVRLLAMLLLACAAAGVAGCSGSHARTGAYHAADISGFMPELSFNLTGPGGQPITAQFVRGKTTILYFGYTNCPDECPTTLARVSAALGMLGPAADQVRVLFVSVDPQRDTPSALARYAHYFAPQVVGASGTDAELTALTKRYRVAYRRDPPDKQGNYDVYHSNAVFVFDVNGRARLLVPDSETPTQLAEDLSTLSAG